jgi:uracil-DNA glycosylase family 4
VTEFRQLIRIEPTGEDFPKKGRGCDSCPLDKVKGIHKVMGEVRGRKIFLWAQSPGPKENKELKELIGPSGEFLWYELKKCAGIERDDVDIQNVVRCLPADYRPNAYPPLKMRKPNKEEIKCCSIYNEQALEHSKAKLHLVFGKIAQASLGKEFKQNELVLYLAHPTHFILQGFRAGDHKQPSVSLTRFREDLRHAKKLLHHGTSDEKDG